MSIKQRITKRWKGFINFIKVKKSLSDLKKVHSIQNINLQDLSHRELLKLHTDFIKLQNKYESKNRFFKSIA